MSDDSSSTGDGDPTMIATLVAKAVAEALAKTVVKPTTPIRGGIDKTHGVFLGGSMLTPLTYEMDPSSTKAMACHSTSQYRDHKDVVVIEANLEKTRLTTTIDKFDGNVSVANGSSELNKIQFIEALEAGVYKHGQEIFYLFPDPEDGRKPLVPLFEKHHRFTVEDVIVDFENRCKTTAVTSMEFDVYEKSDIRLSRMLPQERQGLRAYLWRSFVHEDS